MVHKKLTVLFYCLLLFCKLSAQTSPGNDNSFYKSRIVPAPESVFKKFTEAGMNPVNHVLTETEQQKVAKAFSILPPKYKKILQAHLHSISFMDNMPNTALTSTLETGDSSKQFNITFRAGILHESISEWATRKERTVFDTTATPSLSVEIDAGNADAMLYILLHEATHVIDAVLNLTPHAVKTDSLQMPTAFTKNIWRLFNTPAAKYSDPLLENARFRSGKVQPVSAAIDMYRALAKTPFPSLYAMASCYEDIAELLTIYHLTSRLQQPFVVYVKEHGKVIAAFEPIKRKLVKQRVKQLRFLYQ